MHLQGPITKHLFVGVAHMWELGIRRRFGLKMLIKAAAKLINLNHAG